MFIKIGDRIYAKDSIISIFTFGKEIHVYLKPKSDCSIVEFKSKDKAEESFKKICEELKV